MSSRSKKNNKLKNNDNPESITSGRTNIIIAIIGLLGTLGAAYFGYLGIRAQNEKPTSTPGEVSITLTPTLVGIELTETEQVNPYSLLAEASTWALTESENFDDTAPGWTGFGDYSDEQVQHNMRVEDGHLLWGVTPLVGNK